MKGLSIFGFIELRQMNRTCDFWVAILWMYFKRIQQWGLIIAPQVFCSLKPGDRKKRAPRIFISFHQNFMFRSKAAKVISVYYLYTLNTSLKIGV